MAINQDATVGGVIACENVLKDLVTEHGLDAVLQAIAVIERRHRLNRNGRDIQYPRMTGFIVDDIRKFVK